MVFLFIILSISKYRVETISAHIISVSKDGMRVTINRGSNDNIIKDSTCLICPNRGDEISSKIDFDIIIGLGKIEKVMPDSSIIILKERIDTINVGDYCEVYAYLPDFIYETDIGQLAMYDIVFLDFDTKKPFFLLSDLIKSKGRDEIDRIISELVKEVNEHSKLAEDYSKGTKIMGGIFNGLTWGDAFSKTNKEHIKKFIEFIKYYPGKYISRKFNFIESYATWMISETPDAEYEKKKNLAKVFSDSGDIYIAQKKYEKAIGFYKEALRILPNYQYAKERIEIIENAVNYEKTLEIDPKDVITRFELGKIYKDIGNYDDALEQFKKAKELGYDSLKCDQQIGYIYAFQGNYKDSREIFERLKKSNPEDKEYEKWFKYTSAMEKKQEKETVDDNIIIGDILYSESSYDDAIKYYKKALRISTDKEKVLRKIKKTARRRDVAQVKEWAGENWVSGRFDIAKERWLKAFDICKEIDDTIGMKEILYEMADSMYEYSFYDTAIVYYKKIIEISPDDYDAYANLTNCYYNKKDYDNAKLWIEKGIKIKKGYAWGYCLLGRIERETGELDKAIKNFYKAIELDSLYKWPHYYLGLIFLKKGNYQDARKHLRRAIEIDKDFGDARNALKNLECLIEVKEFLKKKPNDLDTRLRYGIALYYFEDYKNAIEEFKKVVKKREDITAYSYLGYCFTELAQFKEGKEYLEKAYSLSPRQYLKAWLIYNEGKEVLDSFKIYKRYIPKIKNEYFSKCYLKSGYADIYWRNFMSAITNFKKAKELGADSNLINEKMMIAKKGLEGEKLYNQGLYFYNKMEYEEGINYFSEAMKIFKDLEDKIGEMYCKIYIGLCFSGLFKNDSALKYFEDAQKIANIYGGELDKAHCLSLIGNYYWNKGDYEKSLELKEKSLNIYNLMNEIQYAAGVFMNIGSLKWNMGTFKEMIEYYNKAIEIYEKIMDYTNESYSYLYFGEAYRNAGDISLAIDYFTKSMTIGQKYKIMYSAINSAIMIGWIYKELGDTLNSIKYLKLGLDFATAIGDKIQRMDALNRIGLYYLEILKDYEKAIEYFKEVKNLAQLTGHKLAEAIAIANIGLTYSRKGEYGEGLKYQNEALKIVKEVGNRYNEMQISYEMGETYFGLSKYDDAINYYLKAIEHAKYMNIKEEIWKYEFEVGKTFEAKGDYEKAVEYYKKAIETLSYIKRSIKVEGLQKSFTEQEKQTDVYKRIVSLLIKMKKEKEAIKYLEESKSKIVKDLFGDIKPKTIDEELNKTLNEVDKLEKKKENIEKEISEELKKSAEQQDKMKIETLTKTLAKTDGEFNQWMLKLKFQNRKIYDALTINPTTLVDMQKKIPEKSLLLEYFISTDVLYIFCVGNNYFLLKSVDVKESELTGLVDYYIGILKNKSPEDFDELKETGVKLYNYLIKPVEDEISRFQNIIIVPFGILYYLPFQALIKEKEGKIEYLIESARISYVTSATIQDIIKGEKKRINNIFAIGNPDGSLPAALEEVDVLKKSLFKNDAVVWTLSQATKEKFLKYAKDFDIIHLATHCFVSANPLESYLLFAGDNDENKRLTLLEVAGYTMLRDKTDIVFLSACETAKERSVGTGSELISLAEAFAMAGPPTLIATLWEVNDKSTCEVVIRFYDELIKNKGDKLGALRSAQIALLKTKEYSHPFFWAPFILIGDWR